MQRKTVIPLLFHFSQTIYLVFDISFNAVPSLGSEISIRSCKAFPLESVQSLWALEVSLTFP
jgi:hypothetical protein